MDRKRKQQEELTGFDVEGQRVSAEVVGGIAENGDVRGDLDIHRALNALVSHLMRCSIEDLAHKRTTRF